MIGVVSLRRHRGREQVPIGSETNTVSALGSDVPHYLQILSGSNDIK